MTRSFIPLFAAVLALSACGEDTAEPVRDTSPSETPVPADSSPADLVDDAVTTIGAASQESDPASADAALATDALLPAADVGEGWVSNGTSLVFPMDVELAVTVASCAPYLATVFEGGNNGVWAHTSYTRNQDVALTSVTVFPTVAEAEVMVAEASADGFDACWADFNDVAVAQIADATSASYAPVDPPDIELPGETAVLNALEGSIVFGNAEVPDSCVCAMMQQGRAVVIFESAAPAFTAAARRDVLVAAVERVAEIVG